MLHTLKCMGRMRVRKDVPAGCRCAAALVPVSLCPRPAGLCAQASVSKHDFNVPHFWSVHIYTHVRTQVELLCSHAEIQLLLLRSCSRACCRLGRCRLLGRPPRRAQRLAHAPVPALPPVGVRAGGAAVPHRVAGAVRRAAIGQQLRRQFSAKLGRIHFQPTAAYAQPTQPPTPHLHRMLPVPCPAAGPPSLPRLAQRR